MYFYNLLGIDILKSKSMSLTHRLQYGKGFSVINLQRFRQIYIAEPIYATLLHKLSRSHWVELLKVSNNTKRVFYKKQSISANWSVRELKR